MLLDTPICDFDWQAPEFTLPDLDGHTVASAQSYGPNGLLVAFICNHCPYVKAVIARLVADAAALKAAGVNTLAVMPNDFRNYPDDSPDNMRASPNNTRSGFRICSTKTKAWRARSARFARRTSSASTATAACNTAGASMTRRWATLPARAGVAERDAPSRRDRPRPGATATEHGLLD